MPRKNPDQLQDLRDRMATRQGRHYWRSLEELADSEAFAQYVKQEFPDETDVWGGGNRRQFLTLMGASLALAGLTGCGNQPPEKIVPYVRQPEEVVPGKPLYYATAMTLGGIATGLLVESHLGRPTKIEGNPRHPSVPGTLWTGDEQTAPGVSDVFAQAEILALYDPDRSQTVTRDGQISTWDALLTSLRPRLESQKATGGAGIRILTETITSPTLFAQLEEIREQYPNAQWHQFEPVNRDHELAGAKLAFAQFVSTQHHLDRTDVILSLDADFLTQGSGHLQHAFDFANRRDVRTSPSGRAEMNRLYVLESTMTLTGAKADHRWRLRPDQIEAFTIALASRLDVDLGTAKDSLETPNEWNIWLDAIADDLQNYRRQSDAGASLVIAGRTASPLVHALTHAINETLGNVGQTVTYSQPVEAEPVLQYESLRSLVADMNANKVDMLCILGGNPVYSSPADLDFTAALKKVPFRLRLGLYEDETSAHCQWHIPQAHFLESWGDARATDGTASIIQPLIEPLYQGKTLIEVTSTLLGQPGRLGHDVVQEHWRGALTAGDFETLWQTALHDGVIAGTAFEAKEVSVQSLADALSTRDTAERNPDQIDVAIRPDPTVWDGRYANSGWLQELPKPFTTLTWDNAALLNPELAARLELTNGDVVRITHDGRKIEAPIWILPGAPDNTLTVHLGYGRSRAGRVGTATGFDAYQLQSSTSPWHLSDVEVYPTGRDVPLATTQHHHLIDLEEHLGQRRELVRSGTLEELREHPKHPEFMHSHHGELTTLFSPDEHPYDGYKWAMSIDLNRCTGCNACMVACQAENNIPVVGKEQVGAGREMHWIRLDSYYHGPATDPQVVHQPVPCMHCENAPCELVCPVGATVHSDEGLNEMVYNRCVGTRYCSNNCPYKVRRFNFLQYADLETPSLKLLNNPNVTVRNRGVMEKCTYCVQRISTARIEAEKADSTIQDGSLATACQSACPSQAIVFGDLNDPSSRVTRLAKDPLNYAMLEELNTRPRTTYLAAVSNPNPKLKEAVGRTS